jgi:hypothetical protein
LAGAASSQGPITVTPQAGTKHSTFIVGFKAPASTSGSSTTHSYSVSVAKASGSGCVSSASKQIDSATAGQRVQARLSPGASKAWCRGSYDGVVRETTRPRCGYRELCPQFIAVSNLGTFRFRVK